MKSTTVIKSLCLSRDFPKNKIICNSALFKLDFATQLQISQRKIKMTREGGNNRKGRLNVRERMSHVPKRQQ